LSRDPGLTHRLRVCANRTLLIQKGCVANGATARLKTGAEQPNEQITSLDAPSFSPYLHFQGVCDGAITPGLYLSRFAAKSDRYEGLWLLSRFI
jgi:hypothetical protein